MAKEIPYFKFYPTDWTSGDITLENYELQGIFINIAAYYWSKECDLTLINLKKRFRGYEDKIQELINNKILKLRGESVVISFLDEQLSSKELQNAVNKMNGRKGGRPRIEKTEEKPNGFNFDNPIESESKPIDKERDKDIEKEKYIESNTLMSEIKISDDRLSPDELGWFKIAIAFIEVFKANKVYLGDKNIKDLENAKYKAYINPIRLLMTRDGRTKDEVNTVYKYLKGKESDFWKPNILCTEKLRKQFSLLLIAAKNPKQQNNGYGKQKLEMAYEEHNNKIDHSNRD